MARPGTNLYLRDGTWYCRLQYPKEMWSEFPRKKEWSLRTGNYTEAQALASDAIAEHKKLLAICAALRASGAKGPEDFSGIIPRWVYTHPVGTTKNPDGTKVIASEREVMFLDENDNLIKVEDNEKVLRLQFVPVGPGGIRDLAGAKSAFHLVSPAVRDAVETEAKAKRARYKDIDAEVIERYRAKASDDDGALADKAWAIWKQVTGDVLFKDATETDVEAFVAHLSAHGLKGSPISSGRVERIVATLAAACRRETKRVGGYFKTNPFAEIDTGDENDAVESIPYTERDMETVRTRWDEVGFDDEEKLMWVWFATTTARPSELYGVTQDDWEDGEDPDDIDPTTGKLRKHKTRFFRIKGGKNKYAKRALPFPQQLLDSGLLPERIGGPLFKRPLKPLLMTINAKLEKLGLNLARGQSLYSLRHRGKDRLLIRGCGEDARKAIMGHARRVEAHDLYGHGLPMYRVKPWLDKIGY